MGRGSLSALLTGLAVVGVYAACSNDSGGSLSSGRPDGGAQCKLTKDVSTGFVCAAGTACVNSVCVPTCPGGAACPAGQYCVQSPSQPDICAWNSPISCTKNADCPFPQNCVSGLCLSGEFLADGGANRDCTLTPDNCAPDALCQVQSGANGTFKQCTGMPSCGQDAGCPVGAFGSVCNDNNPDGGQVIPGKGRICLFALCMANGDCPKDSTGTAASHCFRIDPNIPYGSCKFGQFGDPCFVDADCPYAARCAGADGGLEDGGDPGACGPCSDGGTTGPCN